MTHTDQASRSQLQPLQKKFKNEKKKKKRLRGREGKGSGPFWLRGFGWLWTRVSRQMLSGMAGTELRA